MSDNDELTKKAIAYHTLGGKPGKIGTVFTKPFETQEDLSLAYTPGVGMVCLEIAKNKEDVYKYTNKGNLVTVLTEGTAVLGLGDIGPEAGYPVMEGKGVLFKKFADVDVFPLCLDCRKEDGSTDVEKFIEIAKSLQPTFGGINLEDIKAPECFEIEERLIEEMNIPIFHDDQHGTAIITLGGLLSSLQLAEKKIDEVNCVFVGAGAAGIATAKLFVSAGVKKENITLCDSKGVIYSGRKEGMNPQKEEFAVETAARTLADAMKGADVFVGVSSKDLVTKEMVSSMAAKSIIFAMANPWPEILPQDAKDAGGFIVGTGRSDFSNQVNNVLGFPGLFRGTLDVRSTKINVEMKLAAAQALADLTQEEIPADVKKYLSGAYPEDAKKGMFDGENPLKTDYIIPKPLDPRVVPRVARAVAQAAMETGVAEKPIKDLEQYEKDVAERVKG
ncbi:MAG: malic enzyme-like NAD(P)-binding protein [Patescibacteria group bacterium]